MNPRGELRDELERIRRTVLEQEEIEKSAILGSGERILAERKKRAATENPSE